jgi:phosphoesterase RecJ-like protein
LALGNYFSANKIKHKVFNKMSSLPRNLNFLSKFDKITDQLPKFYDLIIYVDCGDINRPAIKLNQNIDSINIDHHISNDNFGTVNIVDETKASTAEVLYSFFEQNDLKISKM